MFIIYTYLSLSLSVCVYLCIYMYIYLSTYIPISRSAWRRQRLFINETPFFPLRGPLPSPTPILFGISPQVMSRPGFWPQSAQLTGFWHPPAHSDPSLSSGKRSLTNLEQNIENFLNLNFSREKPVIYIGLGSPGALGLLPDPVSFTQNLLKALEMV